MAVMDPLGWLGYPGCQDPSDNPVIRDREDLPDKRAWMVVMVSTDLLDSQVLLVPKELRALPVREERLVERVATVYPEEMVETAVTDNLGKMANEASQEVKVRRVRRVRKVRQVALEMKVRRVVLAIKVHPARASYRMT